jgi:hypothetical protein
MNSFPLTESHFWQIEMSLLTINIISATPSLEKEKDEANLRGSSGKETKPTTLPEQRYGLLISSSVLKISLDSGGFVGFIF